uniref:RNA methyltransferase n=1 Tax=Anopheles quadriannulatus TaxID=34691 RepID=A0A182WT83_ANOQN
MVKLFTRTCGSSLHRKALETMGESNEQVKHGNYHNYYKFRAEDSIRADILQQHLTALWRSCEPPAGPIHLLDVGCNSGQFTAKVRQILQQGGKGTPAVCAVGLDIDQELCDRGSAEYPDIEFISGNLLEFTDREEVKPMDDPIERCMKARNIDQFDVICCFSVLMYVHLNGGDAGLRRVLDYLCSKGKFLIIELQSWQKYRDQVRRLKRDAGETYPLYTGLQWRGNGGALEACIKSYVQSNGMELVAESAEKTEFDRQLIFFKNKKTI